MHQEDTIGQVDSSKDKAEMIAQLQAELDRQLKANVEEVRTWPRNLRSNLEAGLRDLFEHHRLIMCDTALDVFIEKYETLEQMCVNMLEVAQKIARAGGNTDFYSIDDFYPKFVGKDDEQLVSVIFGERHVSFKLDAERTVNHLRNELAKIAQQLKEESEYYNRRWGLNPNSSG